MEVPPQQSKHSNRGIKAQCLVDMQVQCSRLSVFYAVGETPMFEYVAERNVQCRRDKMSWTLRTVKAHRETCSLKMVLCSKGSQHWLPNHVTSCADRESGLRAGILCSPSWHGAQWRRCSELHYSIRLGKKAVTKFIVIFSPRMRRQFPIWRTNDIISDMQCETKALHLSKLKPDDFRLRRIQLYIR